MWIDSISKWLLNWKSILMQNQIHNSGNFNRNPIKLIQRFPKRIVTKQLNLFWFKLEGRKFILTDFLDLHKSSSALVFLSSLKWIITAGRIVWSSSEWDRNDFVWILIYSGFRRFLKFLEFAGFERFWALGIWNFSFLCHTF